MASPTPPVEPPDTEGEGLLERIGAQIATLATQVSEIDQRMANVETGTPSRPVEVQLSPETIAQIADALAELQAAGSQALDDAFKSASDDLTEALSGLVQAEISRTLSEAGYTVEVSEVREVSEDEVDELREVSEVREVSEDEVDEPRDEKPLAASAGSEPDVSTAPSIVAPLAATSAGAVEPTEATIESIGSSIGSDSIRDASTEDAIDEEDPDVDADGPPLALDDLDDPFLDALIRKEPLSA